MSFRETMHSRIQTSGREIQLVTSGLADHADLSFGSGGWTVSGAPVLYSQYSSGSFDIPPILVQQEVDPRPARTPGESSIVNVYSAPLKHGLGGGSGGCVPVDGRWELIHNHQTGLLEGIGLYYCPNNKAAAEEKRIGMQKWPHPVNGFSPVCTRTRVVYDGYAHGYSLIYAYYSTPVGGSSVGRKSGQYTVEILTGVGSTESYKDLGGKIIEGTTGTWDYRPFRGGPGLIYPIVKIRLASWFEPGRFSIPSITKNTGCVNSNSISKLGFYGKAGHLMLAGTNIFYRDGVPKIFLTLEFWYSAIMDNEKALKWNEQTTADKGKWTPISVPLEVNGVETTTMKTMVVWKSSDESPDYKGESRRTYKEVSMSGLDRNIVW